MQKMLCSLYEQAAEVGVIQNPTVIVLKLEIQNAKMRLFTNMAKNFKYLIPFLKIFAPYTALFCYFSLKARQILKYLREEWKKGVKNHPVFNVLQNSTGHR